MKQENKIHLTEEEKKAALDGYRDTLYIIGGVSFYLVLGVLLDICRYAPFICPIMVVALLVDIFFILSLFSSFPKRIVDRIDKNFYSHREKIRKQAIEKYIRDYKLK